MGISRPLCASVGRGYRPEEPGIHGLADGDGVRVLIRWSSESDRTQGMYAGEHCCSLVEGDCSGKTGGNCCSVLGECMICSTPSHVIGDRRFSYRSDAFIAPRTGYLCKISHTQSHPVRGLIRCRLFRRSSRVQDPFGPKQRAVSKRRRAASASSTSLGRSSCGAVGIDATSFPDPL